MKKVLVLGDVITDRYIHGTSSRLSPEAPVPVVTQTSVVESLGGAGLVYNNLKSLGVDVDLFDTAQPPSTKTRIICDNHYVTRVDDDCIADGVSVLNRVLISDFSEYEYVILSDYNKGTLDCAPEIISYINSFGCKIIVDPKRHYSEYPGAWLVKPNKKEFNELEFNKWSGNIVTTNAEGSIHARIDNKTYCIPVDHVEVSDVTGAGDCFVAALVYGLICNYDYHTCLNIAATAASTSVKHLGTYILQPADLLDTIIFTNGVFDILHKGHLSLLKYAKELGGQLIVGINSDNSVKRLKGESRPINNEAVRKEQLELLPWVDKVFIFDDDTPYNLINQLKPTVVVKGGDYTVDTVVGNDLAKVVIFPTVEGFSTTKIIEASK